MDAAERMQEALDVWTEERARGRRRSGVVARDSAPPPALPAAAVVPPPLPTERLAARFAELEADLAAAVEASRRRVDALEERQRRLVDLVTALETRTDKLTAWALRAREQITAQATASDASAAQIGGRLQALGERVDLEFSAIAERFAADEAARARGLEQLAAQLDALLAEVSIWRGEHEALARRLDGPRGDQA